MEFASYLAGERWSDHPACTHPLLAALARHVNDCTSNAGRQRLAELIPSVIGLTSDDPRADARIALRAATTALPVVAADRVMAVAVLACRQVLADLDGRPDGWLEEESQRALAQAPYAAEWARRYSRDSSIPLRTFCRRAAPSIVRGAVVGIGHACIPDPDRLMRDLLVVAIDDFRQWAPDSARTAAATAPASLPDRRLR